MSHEAEHINHRVVVTQTRMSYINVVSYRCILSTAAADSALHAAKLSVALLQRRQHPVIHYPIICLVT